MRLLSMIAGLFMLGATAQAAPALDPENTLYLQLKDGRVVIALRPDLAPEHVIRIKKLARQGFYDGLVFHRVIDGFMAQTGDPTGTGAGGSPLPDLRAEFSSAKHVRGTLSMARSGNPNSANSQFYICFKPAPFLDGQYTVFGQVVEGMQFVDAIKKGDSADNGKVTNPDKIISMKVALDVDGKAAVPATAAPAAATPGSLTAPATATTH